jgi:di/tricarboxylate transporter
LAYALSVLLLSALEYPIPVFRFPWDIMFLFGGGFALAEASKRSGLSDWVGGELRYIFIQL